MMHSFMLLRRHQIQLSWFKNIFLKDMLAVYVWTVVHGKEMLSLASVSADFEATNIVLCMKNTGQINITNYIGWFLSVYRFIYSYIFYSIVRIVVLIIVFHLLFKCEYFQNVC